MRKIIATFSNGTIQGKPFDRMQPHEALICGVLFTLVVLVGFLI